VISDITVSNCGSPDSYQPGAHDGDAGIQGWWLANLTLINVTVTGIDGHGINSYGRKLTIENSHIINNISMGINAENAKIIGTTLSGNGGSGIEGNKLSITDSTVTSNGGTDPYIHPGQLSSVGIRAGKGKITNTPVSNNFSYGVDTYSGSVKVTNCNITDNGNAGVHAYDGGISVRDSTVTGNGVGVGGVFSSIKIKNTTISANDFDGIDLNGGKVTVSESTVSNHPGFGIRVSNYVETKGLVLAKESTVLGNGTGVNCGVSEVCGDISSGTRPSFSYEAGVNVCDHSYVEGSGMPGRQWGVCYFDCGNGILTGSEICDESGETATCDDDCTPPSCGDGNTNETFGDECDDGANVSNDGCDATCVIEYCGDSIVQTGIGEACDTAAKNTATCDFDCTVPVCGDDVHNGKAGEQCDDGNVANNDGCDSTCHNE